MLAVGGALGPIRGTRRCWDDPRHRVSGVLHWLRLHRVNIGWDLRSGLMRGENFMFS